MVSLSPSKDAVRVGGRIDYTAVVANDGPQTAPGVEVRVFIPEGVIVERMSASQGTCTIDRPAPDVPTCTLGALQAGQSSSLAFRLRVNDVGSEFEVKVDEQPSGWDDFWLNNSLSDIVEVKPRRRR